MNFTEIRYLHQYNLADGEYKRAPDGTLLAADHGFEWTEKHHHWESVDIVLRPSFFNGVRSWMRSQCQSKNTQVGKNDDILLFDDGVRLLIDKKAFSHFFENQKYKKTSADDYVVGNCFYHWFSNYCIDWYMSNSIAPSLLKNAPMWHYMLKWEWTKNNIESDVQIHKLSLFEGAKIIMGNGGEKFILKKI